MLAKLPAKLPDGRKKSPAFPFLVRWITNTVRLIYLLKPT
jgi:hypothetical protein